MSFEAFSSTFSGSCERKLKTKEILSRKSKSGRASKVAFSKHPQPRKYRAKLCPNQANLPPSGRRTRTPSYFSVGAMRAPREFSAELKPFYVAEAKARSLS